MRAFNGMCQPANATIKPEAEITEEDPNFARASPNLAVKVGTSFPQSEIFGVKLVNGHPTQSVVSFSNEHTTPVTIAFGNVPCATLPYCKPLTKAVGGSLWGPDPKTQGETDRIVRNLTSTRYNVQIPPGEKESVSYNFATELHPQDLRLNILAVVMSENGGIYTMNAYNETVSIVEPDASFFDPQL